MNAVNRITSQFPWIVALSVVLSVVLPSMLLTGFALAADRGAGGGQAAEKWIVLSEDLIAFQQPIGDWYIAGDAAVDPKNADRLVGKPGRGVLINGKEGRTENLVTKKKWGDVEVSLEFTIPAGSNSGVKMQGLYEIQIRDSWKKDKLHGDDCGGIYPRADIIPRFRRVDDGVAPKVNATKAPGEWSTLEIAFRAPRFDSTGKKTANARFDKVVLNSKTIHENVEVAYPTGHYWHEPEHATGSLFLQADHGPVAFRNIRLRPINAK